MLHQILRDFKSKILLTETLDFPEQIILKSCNSVLYLFSFFYPRFVVSMTYYGVVLSVGNLGGNFYLNLFLMTVADYPAKLLTLALLDRIGRKRMYVFYMLTCAIACIGTIYAVLEKRECKLTVGFHFSFSH